MPWEMKKSAHDNAWAIMDAGRLRGIIVKTGSQFRVEIPCSLGDGADIMFMSSSLDEVWAFVRGVEAALTRIELPGKPEVVTPI